MASDQNVIAQLGAVRPFVNILASEQVHVVALRAFFGGYGLQLPSATLPGARLPGSWTESCGLGSSIERSLVALYDRQIPPRFGLQRRPARILKPPLGWREQPRGGLRPLLARNAAGAA